MFYDAKIRERKILVTIKAGEGSCCECEHLNTRKDTCDIWGTLEHRGVARRRPECLDAEYEAADASS